MTTSIEKTLEVFRKRTPEQKQKYIVELTRENNTLRNELEKLKLRIEDVEYDIELINKR
jgi:regulator of replication initiation timing